MHLPTHLSKYAGELSHIFPQAPPTKTGHAAWGSQGSRRNGLFPDNTMPPNLFGLVCRYQEPTRGKGRWPSVFCTLSNVLYISLPPGPCRSSRRSVLLDLNSFAKTTVRVSEMSDPRGYFPLIGRLRQDGGVHFALKKPPVGNWPESWGFTRSLGKGTKTLWLLAQQRASLSSHIT
ncbi:hypothetical protein BDV34DRAFT_200097 [Aspergillus parasiticus]|uniref:Uncharacterized protein n=1 Tax=Aspergillus parasiticus TaxID=5067 RepID=A0A5N6DD58_ASPPA|nr:hypothetical protein BDV34DRAFT_200097 [Aspergillus parasiticus]